MIWLGSPVHHLHAEGEAIRTMAKIVRIAANTPRRLNMASFDQLGGGWFGSGWDGLTGAACTAETIVARVRIGQVIAIVKRCVKDFR